MNTQPPEPRDKIASGETLDLHSTFLTIQGEGPFAGHRAIFVRLAGCNLQCPGCDTEYTKGRRRLPITEIFAEVADLAITLETKPLIVITGGEPLRQPIGLFVNDLLHGGGFKVQIESNGVFAPDLVLLNLLRNFRQRLHLVVSPKTRRIHRTTGDLAAAFKYVVDHRSISPQDGLPIMALEHPASDGVARPEWRHIPVYVNPYDAKDEEQNRLNLKAAADSALRFGHILGVQLHKYVGLD